MSIPALRIADLSVTYQGVSAVRGVTIDVPPATCVAVIGANGAGKTSLLRGIGGLASTGRETRIWLGEQRIDNLRGEQRARRGLGHVLEGRHIFPKLSVADNIGLGVPRGVSADEERRRQDMVLNMFPDLAPMLDRPGGSLSGGQQQFLAFARAMMGAPAVILLDEPTVGIAPQLVERLTGTINSVVATGTAVLLVEQAIGVVSSTAAVVHVMSHGDLVEEVSGSDPDLPAIAHQWYLK